MNKVIKFMFLIVIVLFLSLFFSRYYINYYDNRRVLTDEAIDRFEKDLKNGVEINPKNYLIEEKDYSNKASRIGIKISNYIELSFKKGIMIVIKYLSDN